jgi:catechol 2,3-dioxygenase-like lactoylglutathione lyase family enzyme
MRPIPIRYVRDLPAVQRFYEALGLRVDFAGRASRRGRTRWVELVGSSGSAMALHAADDPDALGDGWTPVAEPASTKQGVLPHSEPPVELAFEAEEPLEQVVGRLRAAGFEPATAIVDEAFGRSFRVRDPEGLELQINEHDRVLHG